MPQWSNASMVQCLNASMPQYFNGPMPQCLNADCKTWTAIQQCGPDHFGVRLAPHGLQLHSLWTIPTAAASEHVFGRRPSPRWPGTTPSSRAGWRRSSPAATSSGRRRPRSRRSTPPRSNDSASCRCRAHVVLPVLSCIPLMHSSHAFLQEFLSCISYA